MFVEKQIIRENQKKKNLTHKRVSMIRNRKRVLKDRSVDRGTMLILKYRQPKKSQLVDRKSANIEGNQPHLQTKKQMKKVQLVDGRKNANSKVLPSTKKKSVGRPKKSKHRSESSESTSFANEKSSVGRQRKDANGKVSRSTKKKSIGRPKKRRASESESASFTDEETDEESSVDRSRDDDNKESSEREQRNRLHSNGSKLSSNKPSEDEDNYEVEDIMDFKIEDDKKYFLIRWKGYGPSVDSWEKERLLNCPDLIDKFYEKHPEARISSTKRKRKYDSDYEVSSSNSNDNYDASTIKRSVKRNGKNSTRVEDYSSSDEESESEADTEDLEPKVRRSVGRPKNVVVNVSSSTKHWIVGRPRKRAKSDDEGEENYEVEEIIDFDIEDDIKYFLVRWKGYDSSVDSWEEHRSLNCPELIAKFYKEHPEAQVSAIPKREYDSDDEVSSSGSEYELTDSEQLAIQGSVKKRGKKYTRKRTSRRETNVTSTVSGTDEPEVNEKKSVGRTRKEAMANVSSSPKKRSAGRPKKHEKSSVGRCKVDHMKSREEEEEGDHSVSSSPKKGSVGRPKKYEKSLVGRSKADHMESQEEEECHRSDSDVSKSSENFDLL